MSQDNIPQTLVHEVMVPLAEVLSLSVADGATEVMRKGLYRVAPTKVVVVFAEDGDVVLVATAGHLRGKVLRRTWRGVLGDWVKGQPVVEVSAAAQVVTLGFLVQKVPDVKWLVVVNEAHQVVGVLSREVVMGLMPSEEAATKGPITRGEGKIRLLGESVVNVYYYCSLEQKYYGPETVLPDAEGRMRDQKGHLVQRYEYVESY